MRIVERMLLDPQQNVMKDTQETTSKSRLPAFIPSTGLMGFSLRKLQEAKWQAHGRGISFKSASISCNASRQSTAFNSPRE